MSNSLVRGIVPCTEKAATEQRVSIASFSAVLCELVISLQDFHRIVAVFLVCGNLFGDSQENPIPGACDLNFGCFAPAPLPSRLKKPQFQRVSLRLFLVSAVISTPCDGPRSPVRPADQFVIFRAPALPGNSSSGTMCRQTKMGPMDRQVPARSRYTIRFAAWNRSRTADRQQPAEFSFTSVFCRIFTVAGLLWHVFHHADSAVVPVTPHPLPKGGNPSGKVLPSAL